MKVFNMITAFYESKSLLKHNSCDCRYRLGDIKCNSK